MKKQINLFEAFSWIGSQHQALKNIWIQVNLVWISDWYIDAIVAYSITHLNLKAKKIDRKKTIDFLKKYSLSRDSKKPLKSFAWLSDEYLSILEQAIEKFQELDISKIKWENLVNKNIDLFTYSFPCQDISQQWKQKGFSKWENTRSWLLWEVERILKEMYKIDKKKLPKFLMMENVKAILNKDFKQDLDLWIEQLEKLWYKSTKPFIVNSSDLWACQNRERVFLLSSLEWKIDDFEIENFWKQKYLKDILQKNMHHEEFQTDKNIEIIKEYSKTNKGVKKWFIKWYTSFNAECYVFHKDWKAPTITASGAQSRIKFFEDDWKIYYLNACEHLLLQWFSLDFYKKLKDFWFNETKIKFLAGNSININVLEEIFKFYFQK